MAPATAFVAAAADILAAQRFEAAAAPKALSDLRADCEVAAATEDLPSCPASPRLLGRTAPQLLLKQAPGIEVQGTDASTVEGDASDEDDLSVTSPDCSSEPLLQVETDVEREWREWRMYRASGRGVDPLGEEQLRSLNCVGDWWF